jgi:uncharacterized hydrophobic protein (TIGR00271 family)
MIYYIYAKAQSNFVEQNKHYLESKEVRYIALDKLENFDISLASHLLVTGNIAEIKMILEVASSYQLSIGIIPTAKQKALKYTFDLPHTSKDAIALALKPTDKCIDTLYANDTLVLQEVVIGDAPPLDEFGFTIEEKTYFNRIKIFWRTLRKVKSLKHTQITLKDNKENTLKLSAVGLVGLEYDNDTFASKLIPTQLLANDGKFSLLVLSPLSIVQYIGYLFQSLVSHLSPQTLPRSVGSIRSSQIIIESTKPLDVIVDSQHIGQTPLHLEVKNKALCLCVGKKFGERQSLEHSKKDSIKLDHLPSDSESVTYLSKAIPLFSHASKAQYASLFTQLREEARLSQSFMVLLIFATMIATFGLFINSSSVIIGAMLLAPLMQPIVSLSMGVLRQDISLEKHGANTIALGVLVVLMTAGIITFFTPIERLTPEMSGRLSPTIIDLFIAIVSGLAAAYAKSNTKILGSLAGVSIAVALIPPIAVAGIGLGWGDWHMFFTAFLLFITNLVGIVLAAMFMFALLGYSPLHLAKKGMMIWMLIVAIVAIPLYTSFSTMKADIHIQRSLSSLVLNLGEHKVKLTQIELIHRKKTDEIHCKVIATGLLSKAEKSLLKKEILKRAGKVAEVIVTFRYRL